MKKDPYPVKERLLLSLEEVGGVFTVEDLVAGHVDAAAGINVDIVTASGTQDTEHLSCVIVALLMLKYTV